MTIRPGVSGRLPLSNLWVWVILAALILPIAMDVFRIHFYADDLIFLDAARRMPPHEVLLGHHAIAPWYRPLSRELLFYLILAAGPAGEILSHLIGLIVLALLIWSVYRIGALVGGTDCGIVAAALVATASYTKFLAAWSSGFQDLSAACLTIVAVQSALEGRLGLASVFSLLAPFAKETGFMVFPLAVLAHVLRNRGSVDQRFLGREVAALAGVAIVHVLVRMTWHGPGTTIVIKRSWTDLSLSLRDALASFLPWSVPSSLWAVLIGLAGGVVVVAGLWIYRSDVKVYRNTAETGLVWMPIAGIALGLAPLVLGHIFERIRSTGYYAYPALPWIGILAARVVVPLRRDVVRVAVGIVVSLNIVGLAYREPDLNRVSNWHLAPPDWREAVRVSAATQRLASDVREGLATRPESLVVLYTGLPYGSFFQQTEDGPATREYLRDPTVRAYYVGEAPTDILPERMAIMAFDPATCHLRVVRRDARVALSAAMKAIAAKRARAALAWATYGRPIGIPALEYVKAASVLIDRGPGEYSRYLKQTIFADTTEEGAERNAKNIASAMDGGLLTATVRVLRDPLSADWHRGLADTLRSRGSLLGTALELRMVEKLGITTSREHFVLGVILLDEGFIDVAREELRLAVLAGEPAWAAERASELLGELRRTRSIRVPTSE